jgi:uncharacterized Zn-binding protein involved in type VI secretion
MRVLIQITISFWLAGMAFHASAAGPAARLHDLTSHTGQVLEGSPTVRINGLPAARRGDFATCPLVTPAFPEPIPHVGGPISTGSSSVWIDGLPAARAGDVIIENGAVSNVQIGSSTVIIGD